MSGSVARWNREKAESANASASTAADPLCFCTGVYIPKGQALRIHSRLPLMLCRPPFTLNGARFYSQPGEILMSVTGKYRAEVASERGARRLSSALYRRRLAVLFVAGRHRFLFLHSAPCTRLCEEMKVSGSTRQHVAPWASFHQWQQTEVRQYLRSHD